MGSRDLPNPVASIRMTAAMIGEENTNDSAAKLPAAPTTSSS